MQSAQSPIAISKTNLPVTHPPEITSLARYESEMTHLLAGKMRPDFHRDIVSTFDKIHPILVHNAKFRGKYNPRQENVVLLNIEKLIDHIRSLGKPIPEDLFKIQARYKVKSDCDPSSCMQRYKEVETLFCSHNIDMVLLSNSRSQFDAKCTQIEAFANNILTRIDALIKEVRPGIALAKKLDEMKQRVGKDLLLILDRKRLHQRPSAILCSPSPLTTAAPSFRNDNLDGTRTLNATGLTMKTVSSDSN